MSEELSPHPAPESSAPESSAPENSAPENSASERGKAERSASKDLLVTVAVALGLLVLYFTVPLSQRDGTDWWMLVLTGAAFVVFAAAVLRMIARGAGLFRLLTLLLTVVVVIALGFYALAINRPDEIAGLETRIDALYFTLTTMTTTGYGDIHATGQLARVLVSLVFVFNLVFLGMLGSELSKTAALERFRKNGRS